jgi:hypothetical protein
MTSPNIPNAAVQRDASLMVRMSRLASPVWSRARSSVTSGLGYLRRLCLPITLTRPLTYSATLAFPYVLKQPPNARQLLAAALPSTKPIPARRSSGRFVMLSLLIAIYIFIAFKLITLAFG